ncbi:hypothetical protein Acsp02_93470 [Actinoplanes sp. NBRC 103695]|nr:hypothetical protein Acsp02_93470 [Actinoplanes sp. NBRC 103695]
MLTGDFQSIGEQGFVLDKARWIAMHAEFRFLSLRTSEITVRRYDRSAIVRGVQHGEATWNGQTMALNVRFSQVWVEQADGWRLAALQFSSLGSGAG